MAGYQVFISFKHLGADGRPTRDSHLAQDLYQFLSDRGFRVFFSNKSLEQAGESMYKPAIESALDEAQVLIAVTTRPEHITSEWVRYEWDSFHNDILSGLKKNGRIFVYLDGVSPSALPRALRQCQVFEFEDENEDQKLRLQQFIVSSLGLRPSLEPFSGPWYSVLTPYGPGAPYIDIQCKQCGFETDFTPSERQGPPSACPNCGLR